MTLATVKTFLEMSGADREAVDIVNDAGVKISSDPKEKEQGYYAGYTRYVVTLAGFQEGVQGRGMPEGGYRAQRARSTVNAGDDTTEP